MIQQEYKCDLCRDPLDVGFDAGSRRAFGIHWSDHPNKGWTLADPRKVERHLCIRCISSIQAMPAICSQGFECNGGQRCTSDHK